MGAKHAAVHYKTKQQLWNFCSIMKEMEIFFLRIVTDDETCVSYKTPETK